MTAMEFFGCSMIAFGPSIAMFWLTIAKDPIRIIILISAAFFWLLSLLLSSILWFVVYPLRKQLEFGVFFSVIFQEIFRYLFYKVLRKAEVGLKKVEEVGTEGATSSTNRLILAYVSGLGFGIMSGAFSLINVLADASGPGTVGLHGDSHFFFLTSAFTTLAFILLHTFWGVIFISGWDQRKLWQIGYVYTSHLFVSMMTLFNQQKFYIASLIPIYIMTLVTAAIAFVVSGGTFKSLKTIFIKQPTNNIPMEYSMISLGLLQAEH